MSGPNRWAWAEIDLDAIEHNVGVLRRAAAPADVWAVVKADGYGHGAVQVAERALVAGAAGLCVALVAEGVELRVAGIDAPILVLSEQPPDQLAELVAHRLTPTVYSPGGAAALATLAARAGGEAGGEIGVHVLVDTGMQRVGVSPDRATALVADIARLAPAIRVLGVYTHLACADEPSSPATDHQLAAFDAILGELEQQGLRPPVVHAANSAATLAVPAARHDLVRVGIAMYGVTPGDGVDHLARELRPAMSLKARVSHVKRVAAGSHVSYGWRHRFDRETTVATVPIGYADGVPRRLGTLAEEPAAEESAPGHDVLIGGRRHPIVGVVTMDQLMVEVATGDVAVGDEVVLIGRQGAEEVLVSEWAARLGTIGYEIVCGVGPRVPRVVRAT